MRMVVIAIRRILILLEWTSLSSRFDSTVRNKVTFNLQDSDLEAKLEQFLNSMTSGGGTNYEAAFRDAANWFYSDTLGDEVYYRGNLILDKEGRVYSVQNPWPGNLDSQVGGLYDGSRCCYR